MHNIINLVADELRENAVRLFIDVERRWDECMEKIDHDFWDDAPDPDCVLVRITKWETDTYNALWRGRYYVDRIRSLKSRLARQYDDETYRQSQENRSKMLNPTNPYRDQNLSYEGIMFRTNVGREAGRLIATILKLAHIDPTASPEGIRLLNDTMTRLVELTGTCAYTPYLLDTARERVFRQMSTTSSAYVDKMLEFLDAVRAVWYNRETQAQPVHRRRRPVWHQSLWYRTAKAHHTLHPYVAQKSDTVGGIAVAETYARLYAGRFTVMKPGRYLTRYFGNVLTEYDIKDWAQKQIGDSGDAVVYFAKTADEIVWVYENSPRSCMKMHRDERYIAEDLDESTHPVRAYAHPENHLAVAFIMSDKTAKPDYDRDYNEEYNEEYNPPVAARTVVNTEKKCYYRLYGRNGLESALEVALNGLGYVYRADTLAGELLSMQRVGDYLSDDHDDEAQRYDPLSKGWVYVAAPYVDGGYCYAAYERTPEGREQLRILARDRNWVGNLNPTVVQKSSGVVAVDTRTNWYGIETLAEEHRI